MYLIISDHAYDRIHERMQGEVEIPEVRILKIGALVESNTEFHVRGVLYNFICKRSEDAVVVLTVTYNVTHRPMMTQQNRRAEFYSRHRRRLPNYYRKNKQWQE
jgi:phosphoribosyl-AMP cyclohydrolase